MTITALWPAVTPAVFAFVAWFARGRAARALAVIGAGVTLLFMGVLVTTPPPLAVSSSLFHFDGRAAFHGALGCLIVLVSSAVALGRPRDGEPDRAATFLLAALSASLFALSANGLGLRLAAIELAACLGALLVASDRAAVSLRAAWTHLATTTGAVGLTAIGCVIVGSSSGVELFALAPQALANATEFSRPIVTLLFVAGLGTLLGAAPVGVGISALLRGVDGVRAAPVIALSSIAAVDLLARLVPLISPSSLLAMGVVSLASGTLRSLGDDIGVASHATYAGLVLVALGLGPEVVAAALLANTAHVLARSLRLLAEETPVGGAFDFFARSLGFGGMPPTASFLATLAIVSASFAAGRPWLATGLAIAVGTTGVRLMQDARDSQVAATTSTNPYAMLALSVLAVALLGTGFIVPERLAALLTGGPTP